MKMIKIVYLALLCILLFACSNSPTSPDSGNFEDVWTNYGIKASVRGLAIEGNYIWCATGQGVFRMNKLDGTYAQYTKIDGLIDDDVFSIAVDKNNVKWIGTRRGLSSYNGKNWRSYTTAQYLPDNIVLSIAVDENNTKYVGTNKGIAMFGGTSDSYAGGGMGIMDGRRVASIAVDYNNVIWFGTARGVLNVDGTVWSVYTSTAWESGVADSEVKSVAIDKNNVKWFVSDWSYFDVIVSFDNNIWKLHYPISIPGFSRAYVFSVAVDKNNVKWFGTDGGVCSFDDKIWKGYSTADGLVSNHVNSVIVDSDNAKWFGTDGGVCRLQQIHQ